MKKLLLIAALGLMGCTDAENAQKLLEKQGYTDIQIKGYTLFGCSEKDFQRTEFKAKTITGQDIEGVVCSGLFFKASTVRFYD